MSLVGLLLFFIQFYPGTISASSLSFSEGYSSSNNIQIGSIVSLNPKNSQSVITANVNNVNNLLGVIINKNSSNISFNSNQSSLEVGTSGIYATNVSTINGNIAKGDKITASIIEGVGMKATSASRIVGTAINGFDSTAIGASKQDISGANGKKYTVYVGQTLINVSVADFSGLTSTLSENSTIRPCQSFFSKIVHKNVSQSQTVAAMTIIMVCVIVSMFLILASTIVSIRSIGRNPLARKGITRHTILIILMVTAILLISFAAAYLVVAG